MTTVTTELTPEQFTSVFRHHTAAVAVVTLQGPSGPVGFTATSVISVSATPPVLAFSINSASSSWPALATAETVVVNFLSADQTEVATRFATSGIDRFDADDWSTLPGGEPVLHHTKAWMRGRVIDRFPAGSSHLVTMHALDHAQERPDTPSLLYKERSYLQPGPQPTGPH